MAVTSTRALCLLVVLCEPSLSLAHLPQKNTITSHVGSALTQEAGVAREAAASGGDTDIPKGSTEADWSKCFDQSGRCEVSGLMTGLYRSDSGNNLANLEKVSFLPYNDDELECKDQDWTHVFDGPGWATCPEGYYLSGFRRSSGEGLSSIDAARCCQLKGSGLSLWNTDDCKDTNWATKFDSEGWAGCQEGMVLQGLKRAGSNGFWDSNGLSELDHALCCPDLKPKFVAAAIAAARIGLLKKTLQDQLTMLTYHFEDGWEKNDKDATAQAQQAVDNVSAKFTEFEKV